MKAMNYSMFFLFIGFGLVNCDTYKNCHELFVLKNNSADTLIRAYVFELGASDTCLLSGNEFLPKQAWELYLKGSCWEERLGGGQTMELFILNPASYNGPIVTPCDSIEKFEGIIKVYRITLADLEANNFELSYP